MNLNKPESKWKYLQNHVRIGSGVWPDERSPWGTGGFFFPFVRRYYIFSQTESTCAPWAVLREKRPKSGSIYKAKQTTPVWRRKHFQMQPKSKNLHQIPIRPKFHSKLQKNTRNVLYAIICACVRKVLWILTRVFFSSANISCVLRRISRSRCSQGLSWSGPPCHDLYPCSFLCWHCCCRLCMDHRAFALCLLLCLFSCRCPGCWPHSFSGAFQDVSHSFCDQLSHCLFLTCSDCC